MKNRIKKIAIGSAVVAGLIAPSVAIAVTVPTVSKKSESNKVKTKRMPATTEIRLNEPRRLKCPRRLKSGVSTTLLGIEGTLSPQPFGLTFLPSKLIYELVELPPPL